MMHKKLVNRIANLIKPLGWGWIAPWNGIPKKVSLEKHKIKKILNFQQELFTSNGFKFKNITENQSKYYGINGNVANNIIFYKNLYWKEANF